MNYSYKELSDYKKLFEFYNSVKEEIPYWFDVNYEVWYQSMFEDTDYESTEFFHELNTYVAYESSNIVGFIQFGIPNYIYEQNGEKSFEVKAGIIRNLYFGKEHEECGMELVKIAEHYFEENKVDKKFAFFHAFGMTCNAGHGKLHDSQKHIEERLKVFGYAKEHENVYYKKILTEDVLTSEKDIEIRYSERNEKGLCGFSIFVGSTYIGAGEIVYLPQETIAYLKWIYIEKEFQQKGYASKALKVLFANLYQKGIRRFDTDTADGNMIAQRLYEKNGFENMGRTRSYLMY
ncbi:MAG: GNAT family N-acetyltransferase [Roseburia sp.]